jgi:hypothetical protein
MSERDAKAAEAALQFFGQTLDWLEGHHSHWAEVTTHDLDADERVNAIDVEAVPGVARAPGALGGPMAAQRSVRESALDSSPLRELCPDG